jgi:hypothetical protein
MLNINPIMPLILPPAPPTALIFKDNESGEDGIVITREDFARDWVHWDRNNDDYEDCVETAWCYLCGDCEVANGEGYINIVYEEDEDEDIEAKVGWLVTAALAYAENSLDENAADDPV